MILIQQTFACDSAIVTIFVARRNIFRQNRSGMKQCPEKSPATEITAQIGTFARRKPGAGERSGGD
jgi:hypothetical protein